MTLLGHRPGPKELDALLAQARAEHVTYREVGATAFSPLPPGYHHTHRSLPLGTGDAVWSGAEAALRRWEAHRQAGVTIAPVDSALVVGHTVVSTFRVGPAFMVLPCRIVYVTVEEDRFGFAYGTLPGHPERGEEAFHIVRSADGAVRFEIVAFSRPATVALRLTGPVGRMFQHRVSRQYLEGVRRAVSAAGA